MKREAVHYFVYIPVESLTLSVFFLLISAFQALESLDVLNGFKCFVEVIHNVSYERFDVLLKREDSRNNVPSKPRIVQMDNVHQESGHSPL